MDKGSQDLDDLENSLSDTESLPTDIKTSRLTADFSAKGILTLAIPALGSLIIEPLLILIDSVMVGHLGTSELAGLSLASTILNTVVGVFVFLAYSTTAQTARLFGAGKKAEGLKSGIEALWLSFGLGIALVIALEIFAPLLVTWMGADQAVAASASEYLRAAAPGMIGMLAILAATGTLRGLLDTKTPLYVLAVGSVFNVAINVLLIYGLNLGLLGAGIGLSITQTLMGAAMVYMVVAAARKEKVSLRPTSNGVKQSAGTGLPLFIRTISLRIALLTTVAVATQAGTAALAAYQVVNSIWTMAAFALDALAIAAQGLVGVALGMAATTGVSSDLNNPAVKQLRQLIRRLSWWGIFAAAIIGAVMVITSPWIPLMFGSDPQMHTIAQTSLVAAGLLLPIGGLVFILDGVLIGASQGPYLAKLGVVTLVLYLPALFALHQWITATSPLDASGQQFALMWLWIAFAGWFMFLRAASNSWRAYRTTKLLEIKP